MNVMFSKWKHKGENGVGGGLEKDDDHRGGYRTHLIFAGKRDPEGTGGQPAVPQGGFYKTHSASYSSHSNHPFAHADMNTRHHPETSRRKISRALVDDGRGGGGGGGAVVGTYNQNKQLAVHHRSKQDGSERPGMLEVVAELTRDCFIIPLACVDRFLPAGFTLPELKSRANNNVTNGGAMNVLEVTDPQLAVVVHLMTPLIPLNPPLESPLSQPEMIQRTLALQLSQKASAERQASHGLLLASMETNSDFPLMELYILPTLRTDATDFLETARKSALEAFEPSNLGYCGDHFFHLCREVATIARPPLENPAGKGKSTGYVVSIFRVFDGDDKEKLERNWLYWTGARTLYRHLPKSVGLRRITLHKSAAATGDKLYLLLCECSNFLENVNAAAQLLPALRARLCGYTGIYRVASAF